MNKAVTKEQLETIERLANRGERFRADTMLDLCAAVRERDATIAKLTVERDRALAERTSTIRGVTAEGADHARHVLMDMLDADAQEIANANGNTAEDIAAHVRFILDHRGQEIARLRRVLVNVSTCLLVSTDPLSMQMRTGIDIVLAAGPGSVPDPRDARIAKLEAALRRLGERAEGEDFVAGNIVSEALAARVSS